MRQQVKQFWYLIYHAKKQAGSAAWVKSRVIRREEKGGGGRNKMFAIILRWYLPTHLCQNPKLSIPYPKNGSIMTTLTKICWGLGDYTPLSWCLYLLPSLLSKRTPSDYTTNTVLRGYPVIIIIPNSWSNIHKQGFKHWRCFASSNRQVIIPVDVQHRDVVFTGHLWHK